MKTRFAPSPTGYIHLGNSRTALFNALALSEPNDKFLLRIEDTDVARSKHEFVTALVEDLHWLGINWQDGYLTDDKHDENNTPYKQSNRGDIYDKYYQELLAKGLAYPCFCSQDELALARKIQLASGKAPRYAKTCCKLTKQDIQEKYAKGQEATIRFKLPDSGEIKFTDVVRGEQSFQVGDLGDFIIKKTNGTPSFMFCNAIDDALMQVTHVMRGEDHLTNTPRQLLILEALDLPKPQYAHISLIIGNDNTPLSKRNGSSSIQDLRTQGFLAIAVTNYMARLGHNYESNELLSFAELTQQFSLKKLISSSAKYNHNQLMHWQQLAILKLTDNEINNWLTPYVKDIVPAQQMTAFTNVIRENIALPKDAILWAEILFGEIDVLSDNEEFTKIYGSIPKDFFKVALDFVKNNQNINYDELCNTLKQSCDVKGKALFLPLRLTLSATKHGPKLADILGILPNEIIEKRFALADERVNALEVD